MNNIVFDLDGTLIDSSERMYQLFQELVPESNLSKNEYWVLKRNKVSHKKLLSLYFPSVDFEKFNKRWLAEIEDEEYLAMDQCYPDTIEVLERLQDTYRLILLTARQSKSGLYSELDRLNIRTYFKTILTTENICTKEDLLRSVPKTNGDYFISDMGTDIQLGKKYEYRTVAITHGFMNGDRLREYKPDYIIDDLMELLKLLNIE